MNIKYSDSSRSVKHVELLVKTCVSHASDLLDTAKILLKQGYGLV